MKLPSNRLSSVFATVCVLAFGALSAHAGMKEALQHLRKAKEAAENSTADKGGHRKKAIAAIEAAIAQVEAGMEFDKENVSKKEEKKKDK